jgi:maltose alpha-D-glucosyltransferase/alpha-amylase
MSDEINLDPLWYKDAIVYEVHVRSFFDSTNDGVGDFPGLTQKLDYVQSLGVDALWLLPFYPSPLRDDGYDIALYEGVHPSYGTLRDFRAFMREAHARGIRVITELVVNHTSDQHPWFQAARQAPPGSPRRNFYVWSETKQRYTDVRIIFTDSEQSNWTWDDEAKAYYWHRFFHHQPDLNFDNPEVLQAILKVMHFWLDLGVDGMRLDAIPYLIEREGTICENLAETHQILREMRRDLDAHYRGRFFLAEANQWPADVRAYFGDGDECHMAFHFPLMPRIFMALRQEDRHPITEILRQTPDIPETCQWATFLRNHDELTLEMVTDEERDYLYRSYAADPQMRVNVGIRRRLAPLMENNRLRIELLNGLLFSLPGTPVLYYGDELGMGDNIYLGDRNGVRTPMQWTGDRNGGFSRADPARLFAPAIMDPVYGYQAINVEAQERSPFSLLNWMKRMIALRRQHRTFSRGTLEFLYPQNRKVLAYVRRYGDDVLLAVANLSRTVQPVELNLSQFRGHTPIEMLGRTEFPRIGDLPYFLTLAPYGFYWFELPLVPVPIAVRVAQEQTETIEHMPALFVGAAWDTVLDTSVRTLIERDLLLPFLHRQRWFGGKAREPRAAQFVDWGPLWRGVEPAFLTIVEVQYADGGREPYVVPLAIDAGDAVIERAPHAVLARVTGARKGVLFDATHDEAFGAALLDLIEGGREIPLRRGTVRAAATSAYPAARGAGLLHVARGAAEQSNTSLVYGERLILKLFRRFEPGPNPDVEIGRYLTERAGFTRVPAVAGEMAYQRPGEPPGALAMLQGLVSCQADGWRHAVDELSRYFERAQGLPEQPGDQAIAPRPFLVLAGMPAPRIAHETMGGYLESAARLGGRTAELHLALARESADPAFAPEPLEPRDLAALAAEMRAQAQRLLAPLETGTAKQPPALAARWSELLGRRDALFAQIDRVTALRPAAVKTRVHGDYHLGQVLWAEGDFFIFDFEGEPARPLAERRAKQSPLKDVAGMLRSFSYAAYASLFAHTLARPDEFDRLERWARLWQIWSAAAFLKAYLAAAGRAPFLPPDPAQAGALLEAFVLDKALYELHYELNNRPDWVRIPLSDLLALAAPIE